MYPTNFSEYESGFDLITLSISVRQTYEHATRKEFMGIWKHEIDKEHDSLRNRTQTLVKRLSKLNVLPSK